MVQNIKSFCDKIDSIKKMADDLRQTSPSDPLLRNKIENIKQTHYWLLKQKLTLNFLKILMIMKKLLIKTTITIIMVLTLTNCSTVNRTHIGVISGGGSTTALCVAGGITDPYAVGGCAIIGAFAGAELLYNSDKDVHNAVFVDHLNTAPNGSSYTNWYNSKTGNSGIIHTTKSYTQGP